MIKLFAAVLTAALLGGCAATAEKQEHCTPQYPPGPCVDAPVQKGK